LPRPEREWADGGRPGQGLGSERHRSSERPSWPRQSPKCLGFRLGENAAKPVWARRGPRRLKSIAFDMCSGREWTPEARRLESGAKRKTPGLENPDVLFELLRVSARPRFQHGRKCNGPQCFVFDRDRAIVRDTGKLCLGSCAITTKRYSTVVVFCARVSSCTNALTERTGMHVSTLWANCFGGAVCSHGVDIPPDCSIAELSASETRFV